MEYDSVLDERFGESGTIKREVFSRWGVKADCGNMTHAETGFRVLPYKCLARLLEAFGLKAVIVRPGLEGWNKHSLNMNLEEMLVAIGEPVKRWRRKE